MSEQIINQSISDIRRRLSGKYPKGEIDAFVRIIFRNLLGYEPVDILLHKDSVLPDFLVEKINKVVDELLKNRPIQYIFGRTYFYGHVFRVDESTLIPRQETEELVDMITGEAKGRSDLSVLDAATGCGCIAISLALALRFPEVRAFDISEPALSVARSNARDLKARVEFFRADMLSLPSADECLYDIIACNPPYIADSERAEMESNVVDYEPWTALFVPDSDPLLHYRAVAGYGLRALKPGGSVYFEINSRFAGETRRMLAGMGYEDVDIRLDMRRTERFAVGRKGGRR